MIENGTRDTGHDLRNLLRMVDAFGVPRTVLLPAILGHPAVFPDRRFALAQASPEQPPVRRLQARRGHAHHRGKLRARGLDIAERSCGDDITEFTVTDPGSPGKGTVHVSYDGYVTWEFLTEITG